MLLTVMLTEPVLPPPSWYLILRPERSNLEAGLTWWRTTTCHFEILLIFDHKKPTKYRKEQKPKAHSSLSKRKFKSEPVTGSKQKHMAVSSIAGSAHSLKYPLKQGLLSKEQLNCTMFKPYFRL